MRFTSVEEVEVLEEEVREWVRPEPGKGHGGNSGENCGYVGSMLQARNSRGLCVRHKHSLVQASIKRR